VTEVGRIERASEEPDSHSGRDGRQLHVLRRKIAAQRSAPLMSGRRAAALKA
jgi:hypothetical protein